MLKPGDRPADFTLQDQDGREVAWSSFRGAPVVVFFYPKADTPGCTREACGFRDHKADLAALGVSVVGISADTVKRQAGFARKHELRYPLLADPDGGYLVPAERAQRHMVHSRVVQHQLRSVAEQAPGDEHRAEPEEGHGQHSRHGHLHSAVGDQEEDAQSDEDQRAGQHGPRASLGERVDGRRKRNAVFGHGLRR